MFLKYKHLIKVLTCKLSKIIVLRSHGGVGSDRLHVVDLAGGHHPVPEELPDAGGVLAAVSSLHLVNHHIGPSQRHLALHCAKYILYSHIYSSTYSGHTFMCMFEMCDIGFNKHTQIKCLECGIVNR